MKKRRKPMSAAHLRAMQVGRAAAQAKRRRARDADAATLSKWIKRDARLWAAYRSTPTVDTRAAWVEHFRTIPAIPEKMEDES